MRDQESGMRDQEIRAALDRHWAASDANDFETEHSIYREDAVLEYPQSGEQIRGRRNIQITRTLQRSKKRFAVRRVSGSGDLWVTEYILTYDGKPSYTVSIMEFSGDKVARETQYFADPFEAQEAQKMRLAMTSIKLMSSPYDFEKAFRTSEDNGVQILLVLSSPLFAPHNKEIIDLAMRYRLPAMFTFKFYVEAGGLMSYGVDTEPLYRRGAAYVAKILRGAKASDLPVEQASNFEFTLNLKTAKATGFTLPTSILLRANEVIE